MTNQDARDALGRLLGPSAPEVSCDECFELLDRYVDTDLSTSDAAERMPGLAAHLAGCPACAEEHASLRDFVVQQRDR